VRIERVEVLERHLPLTRPYTIARETISEVELAFVRIHAGGLAGSGCASPAVEVTGESPAACREALAAAVELLTGVEAFSAGTVARLLERDFPRAPAARAAIDMALWDLTGQRLGLPLVDLLGRCHRELPTSVTIGIQPTVQALESAREYLAQGFRALKVKIGHDVEEEVDRLKRLRALVGEGIALRVDANEGYDHVALYRFLDGTCDLALELCEQPLPRGEEKLLASFPAESRARLAADESVHGLADAGALLKEPRPFGAFVIKLMKCGGISPALRLAHLAEGAELPLMWGCNDESRISIAAALHVAFASPATRWLDLDGSFDLASDVAEGGFVLEHGMLRTAPGPGLGLRWTG
jgi:L-alanine-DL-glutamate epimerase-like enolase superfamily enzyme